MLTSVYYCSYLNCSTSSSSTKRTYRFPKEKKEDFSEDTEFKLDRGMEMKSEYSKQNTDDDDGESFTENKDVTAITGENGFWQVRVVLVFFIISIPGAAQNLAVSFLAPNIDYWCERPPEAVNVSVETWKKLGLPPKDPKVKYCFKYSNITFPLNHNLSVSGLLPVACESWEFDHSFYTSTLLEKFDLVCDQEWLISLSKSVYMAGLLVSVTFFGNLADKIGRRPTIAGCCILSCLAGFACAFSTSFTMYLVARCLVAMGAGGYYNNLSVLLMEIVGPRLRSSYSNTVLLGWAVGFVCLPGVVWLIRDWFWIQIAITAPYIIFMAVWWMIPESPRWLLSNGKTDKAKECLREAAKMNNRRISDMDKALEYVITVANENRESEEKQGNIFDLVKTPGLWQINLNIVFAWFVISFIYYGLSFNTNDLAGDPLVNFAASGVVEFPGYGFAILLLRYVGRKKAMSGTMIMSGLMCLLSYFIPNDPPWLSTVFPTIGKFFITSCYGIVHVFTLELLPTVVRSSGLGLANVFEQLGSIIAPFVRELGIATRPFVPFIVFGILACMSGFLALLLPETANKKLPDTIKEATEASTNGYTRYTREILDTQDTQELQDTKEF